MPNAIGTNQIDPPSFTVQLQKAGVAGYPFSFGIDGTFNYGPSMTSQQIAQVQAVYAAHDPVKGELLDYANAAQGDYAAGGFTATINGKPQTFDSSSEGLRQINSTGNRLQQPNPPATISWQFDPTNPLSLVVISAADFAKSAAMINDFVNGTYTMLMTITGEIQSGQITVHSQIDALLNSIPNSGNVS